MQYAEYQGEWARLYEEEGWNLHDLADKYDCSPQTVRRHLHKVGVVGSDRPTSVRPVLAGNDQGDSVRGNGKFLGN